MRITWRERLLIEADLVARLKRRKHRFSELVCVGTPAQTLHELEALQAAGLVVKGRGELWRYAGLDQKLPGEVREK